MRGASVGRAKSGIRGRAWPGDTMKKELSLVGVLVGVVATFGTVGEEAGGRGGHTQWGSLASIHHHGRDSV
jgi:hypothetical protein